MSFSSTLSSVASTTGMDDREAPADDEILARAAPMVLPHGLEWSEGSDELDDSADGEKSSDEEEVDWISQARWQKAYSTDRKKLTYRWMHETKWHKNSLRNPSWQPSDQHTELAKTRPHQVFWESFGLSREPPPPRPGTSDRTEYVLAKEPLQQLMDEAREHRRERVAKLKAKKEAAKEKRKRKHSKDSPAAPVRREIDGRRSRERSDTSSRKETAFSVSTSRSPGPSSEAGPSSRPISDKIRRRPGVFPESSADEGGRSRPSMDRRNTSEESGSLEGRKKKKIKRVRRQSSSEEEEQGRTVAGNRINSSMWNVLMDDAPEPSTSSSRAIPSPLAASSISTTSTSTQPLCHPTPLAKSSPTPSNSTPITPSNAAPSQPPTNSTQPTSTTSNPLKSKSHKYNPQKAPRMKMMDDEIDIDVRRRKRNPSPDPVVKKEVVQSPVTEKRDTRRSEVVGSFATSSGRGVGGAGVRAVGQTAPLLAGRQDPRSGGMGTEATGGRGGRDVVESSFDPLAKADPRSRDGPLPSSHAVSSEPVSNTSIQDVLDEFDLPPDPVLPAPSQARRPSVQIPSSRLPNLRDPRLSRPSIKIPDEPPVASPSPSTTSTSSVQPSTSAATSIPTSHPSAASPPPPTPPQLAEQQSKKPDAISYLPPEFSSSWLNEIKGLEVVVLKSNEDKKNKNVFKAITSALKEQNCRLVPIPSADQPHDQLSLPDVVIGSSLVLTPEASSHLDWIVDMRRAGTRFFVFRGRSASATKEDEDKKRKMVELGRGRKSQVCFSPSALVDPGDTMEALETNLLQNLRRLPESWSARMLPQVLSNLQSRAGDRNGVEKRTLQQVSTASFLHQAFDEISYSSSTVLPDFTPGTTSQERDAHTIFQMRLQSPLVDTFDGLLRVCQDVSRPGIEKDLERATRLEIQSKQMDPAFVEEYRRFIFVTNEKPDPIDCGESWEGIEVMTFAELDQEIRRDLEDFGIEAVPSTWDQTKEWVETHL